MEPSRKSPVLMNGDPLFLIRSRFSSAFLFSRSLSLSLSLSPNQDTFSVFHSLIFRSEKPRVPPASKRVSMNLLPEMSAFPPLELMDSFSHYLYREAEFPEPTLSSSIHFPLAYTVKSEDDYLTFESSILNPSSIPVDLPSLHCRYPHCCNHLSHHCHHYHSLPLSRPPPYFIDAARDLFQNSTAYRHWHYHAKADPYDRDLGDRLTMHELGLDRALSYCIGSPDRKWKWKAEFKGLKGNMFDHKYKCMAESKGAVEKKVKWTVDLHGKGKHAPLSRMYKFHAASLSPQDVCEKVKKEKKTDQKLISIRQALGHRSVKRSKSKKKEHSRQDAAMAIQRTFRDYMSRRSRAVHCLRDLAVAKSKLREIRILISRFSYRHRLAKDAEERQRFSEKIIILLLTVDSIEAPDYLVRSAKRSMTRELEAVLEAVDPQLMSQRKFDLPSGFSSVGMASGVADIIRMLDQEDTNGSGILPVF